MSDREVTVRETDLRWLWNGSVPAPTGIGERIRAALDALGPEPCGPVNQEDLIQIGWWSDIEKRFNRIYELKPSAPAYKGDAVPVYVRRAP